MATDSTYNEYEQARIPDRSGWSGSGKERRIDMYKVWAYGTTNTDGLPELTRRLIGVAASRQEAMELLSQVEEDETPEIVEADGQSMAPDRADQPVGERRGDRRMDMCEYEVWALATDWSSTDGLPVIVERLVGVAGTEEEVMELLGLIQEDETPAIGAATAA